MATFRPKPIFYLLICFALLASLLGSSIGVTTVYAAGITVNSDGDISADDGTCTLREAIANANDDLQLFATGAECASGSGDDTITFDPSLSGATIHLSSPLAIFSDMTIDGSSQVTISGGASTRVFHVDSGTVTLNSLMIMNGSEVSGGGIYNDSGATLTITDSTLSGNAATGGSGGGIINYGTLTVTNSTFSGNSALSGGGGIYNAHTLTIINSTFSENSAGSGGGIYNANTLTVTHSTFSGNSAGSAGGGIYNATTLNYANTIIANSTGDDCTNIGSIGTNLNNLVEDDSCDAGLDGDPNLGALADNGGATWTFALLTGSPAIDAGDDTTCTNLVPLKDQRGAGRAGTGCDIGAYELELQGGLPSWVVSTFTDTNTPCDVVGCSLRAALASAGDGDTITFAPALSGGTILVAAQLEILEDVTIDGSDLTSKISISGGDSTRVFLVAGGVTATLDSLIVTQGHVEGCCGGGLLNNGTLTITNSLFSANNNNNGVGGAIMNTASGTLTVTDSTISGNSASTGGGIGNWNQMTITNSTFSANSSGDAGGGIYSDGATTTLTVTNSTFSGNAASTNPGLNGSGGGIFSSGTLTVRNSTFSDNSADFDAGGIAQDSGTLNLSNTIIANSFVVDASSETDCRSQSAIGINTNNLVEQGSNNCSSTLNVDPNLGPLANNGGVTQTFALLANSPAIDAGNDTVCATAEVNNLDQRGITRPNGDHCDIGSYEYVDTTAPNVTVFSSPASPATLNIPITFTASDDSILTGYLITESATPPILGNPGWTASAPTAYPVASMGSYTLYPWVKDGVGHVSAVYGSPAVVNITCLASITVTSSANSGAGTLRQALTDVCMGDINNISMIDFASGLSGSTIHLTSELLIDKNVTIDGSDLASPITISGDDIVRVFNIPTIPAVSIIVTLDSLIVTEGATSGDGAGLFMGQGIHVTIKKSIFSDNHAGGNGGGIGNKGGLTLIDSTVSGNSAAGTGGGGGIDNESGATITNSTISDNTATGTGGAGGGGLLNTGPATITNSTFFGNAVTQGFGGGISTTSNLTITNSTIAGNSGFVTGGLMVQGNVTHLRNTIIANNTNSTSGFNNDCDDISDYPDPASPDGDGIMTNVNNLIGDGSCPAGSTGFQTGAPSLGPLANNGGLTQTLALLAGSPAINAGDDTICAGTYHPATNPNPVNDLDQRGSTRSSNGPHCDIGAFEYQDAVAPFVSSSTRVNPNPTGSMSVDFTVTFSEPVIGVTTAGFSLSTSGMSGATISSVSGSNSMYTVTVNTGTGSGTVRLDVLSNGTITDRAYNPITTAFASGETYTVVRSTLPFSSIAANDGWILESAETSTKGGALNTTNTTFLLGDDASDRQYRAVLHFNTSSLPDTAVITSVTLKIKQNSVVGTNPFTILGNLRVDMRKPAFGTASLTLADFKSAAGINNVSTFGITPVAKWYSAFLNSTGNGYISRTGNTQFRLYFTTDDNNDNGNDFIKFFSGNAGAASRPKLIIEYYVP